MDYETKFPDWKDRVITASKNAKSGSEAAALLDIKYSTYKKYAIKYNCFIKNQGGKGIPEKSFDRKISLSDILKGLHPQYQSNKLRIRLLQEKVFEHRCSNCNLSEWLNKPIPLELEHINGKSSDHRLENLTLLCPNCHSFTSTYRGKNKI